MRCFIGVELPWDYQEALEKIRLDWQPELKSRLTWTKKGNWHLTLYFLGEVEKNLLEKVKQGLNGIKMQEFRMQAGGGGFFPPGKKPRVIWIGVKSGAEECINLAAKVESVAVTLGFAPNKKHFKPHLTLARVKQANEDNWSKIIQYLNKLKWKEFLVQEFILWQSQLTPAGPKYHALERFALS